MAGRREFIRNGLIGSAGLALGGLTSPGSLLPVSLFHGREASLPRPVVEAEEQVYSYIPAENGAGPMWCAGSTCIVRAGKDLFASGLETIEGLKPLNNCRWMLFGRTRKGWEKKLVDIEGRTREPAPMATFHDGRYFMSVNPTLTGQGTYDGPSKPGVLAFRGGEKPRYDMISPLWNGTPPFTEHSYRSFAADGRRGELILFQNIGYTHAEYAFMDSSGKWSAQGKLEWPFGSEYEEPEPIRVCYPNVALRNRSVFFCGVSDIIEPNKEWRRYKREITGKEWDYDFRRLFFTWCDDITTGTFHPWVELASREKTCGWIFPADLWVAPDGAVHILWTERAIDERLRDKYFPGEKQSHSLNYAIVRDGKIVTRHIVAQAKEGAAGLVPGNGRFHITPDNRLFVIYFTRGTDPSGKHVSENRLVCLEGDAAPGPGVRVPLKRPFSNFFTATERAGSKPSHFIDILGVAEGTVNTISYARIKLL